MAALGIFLMLSFVLGLAAGARGWDVAVLALALFTAFVGLMPIIVDQSRPMEKRQLLITLVMMSYMVFLVVPTFTNYFMWDPREQPALMSLANLGPETIVAGQIVSLLGLVCMLLGFYLPIGRFLAGFLPRPSHEWSPEAALSVAAVMLPLGWAIYLGGQFGLVPRGLGSGVLGAVSFWAFGGISLLTLVYLRYRSRQALIFMLAVIPPAMLFNFFTGSKRLFLTPPFMVALAYIVVERRIRRSWLLAAIGALIILYPISQFYRTEVTAYRTLSAVEILSNPTRAIRQMGSFLSAADAGEYLTSGLRSAGSRLDGLGILCVIVRDTPDKVPYQGGWTIGYIALSYVPRILWPGKPATTIGEWVTDSYAVSPGANPENPTDIGPSWMGEWFFNWGYPGVAAGMFALGLFFRIIQELCFRIDAPLPALLMACFVIYATARTIQSGINGPINGIVYSAFPLVALHMLVRMFGRPMRVAPIGGPARVR